MEIVTSAAKSWYGDDSISVMKHSPGKAYDGDYSTTYRVKDGDAEGNYLKLYLSQKYKIGTVTLTNEWEGCFEHRIIGTVVKVYSVEGEDETQVGTCGSRISGALL